MAQGGHAWELFRAGAAAGGGLSEAENKAAEECTEREKQEARVGEVQKELQTLVKKHETLELDSKAR